MTEEFHFFLLPLPPRSLTLIENKNIMLKTILSISGKPGLYKLVSHGKNMLIVESLTDNKRVPAYAKDKVISGDVKVPEKPE